MPKKFVKTQQQRWPFLWNQAGPRDMKTNTDGADLESYSYALASKSADYNFGGIGLSPIISWCLNKNHFGFVLFFYHTHGKGQFLIR